MNKWCVFLIPILLLGCADSSRQKRLVDSASGNKIGSDPIFKPDSVVRVDSSQIHYSIWTCIVDREDRHSQDWFGHAFVQYLDSVPKTSIYLDLSMPTQSYNEPGVTRCYVFPHDDAFGKICSDSTVSFKDCELLFKKHWNDKTAWAINIFLYSHFAVSTFDISFFEPNKIEEWKVDERGMKKEYAFWTDFFKKGGKGKW